MAEKKQPEGDEGEQPAVPRTKTKLLVIIGVAVVFLIVVVGGGIYFLTKKKTDQVDEETADEPAKEEKAKKAKKEEAPPVFVKLEPFTVKLQSEGQDAYLQTTPELKVLEPPTGEKVKQYMPEIRHHVLLILAAKKPADIATPQGVQQLANEIRDDVNGILGEARRKPKAPGAAPADKAAPDDPVQAVMFTSFIVQ
jgi:flagellar FliL protein